MSRDWQKDMERVQLGRKMYKTYGAVVEGMDPKESLDEVLIYWLQQYAAEKERADKAEELEQKLREAAEKCINIFWEVTISDEKSLNSICDILTDVLDSLYPKEETK